MANPPEGTCATFQIPDEGHSLGNVLRFMLNKECAHEAAYCLSSCSHHAAATQVCASGCCLHPICCAC